MSLVIGAFQGRPVKGVPGAWAWPLEAASGKIYGTQRGALSFPGRALGLSVTGRSLAMSVTGLAALWYVVLSFTGRTGNGRGRWRRSPGLKLPVKGKARSAA